MTNQMQSHFRATVAAVADELLSLLSSISWLKYVQSETTGIKLGFSKGEVEEIDATIKRAWQETVESEVNRRLAERGLTLEVQPANINQRQIRAGTDVGLVTAGQPESSNGWQRVATGLAALSILCG